MYPSRKVAHITRRTSLFKKQFLGGLNEGWMSSLCRELALFQVVSHQVSSEPKKGGITLPVTETRTLMKTPQLVMALVMLLTTGLIQSADTSTERRDADPHRAYMQPMPELTAEQLSIFKEGEKAFMTSWVVFPQLNIPNWDYLRPLPMFEWGLGPTFLANSCAACHVQAGRGRTTEARNTPLVQQQLRLSVPGETAHGGPMPHPNYGNQLQLFDVITKDKNHIRQGEADLFVDWLPYQVKLADGTVVELRKPQIRVENLNFGELGDGVMTSLRNSRVIFGLGYLEAVSESEILALAKAQKSKKLNGRINYVRDDIHDKLSIGRFGWKANQPSVRQQIAAAFHGDMGVTSWIYPKQNCPPVQQGCKEMLPGDKVELREQMLDDLTFWVMALDAPAPRDQDKVEVKRGERLFTKAQCAECHVPELRTGAFPALPQLSHRRFRAYTDMLIHDMGDGLADGRPDFKAGSRDWRTPPLWGVGLSKQVNGSTNLLHDGRARNVLEAILWHDGEARAARDKFAKLKPQEREDLIAFVNSL
ncbi:MAG: hypothetical protein RLZZ20_422 [Pseudomonadota bacterium]